MASGLQLHQPRAPLVCKAGRPLPARSKRAKAAKGKGKRLQVKRGCVGSKYNFHLPVRTKQLIPVLNASCLVLQSVLTTDSPCKFSAPNST